MTIERRNVGKRLSDLVIYAPPPNGRLVYLAGQVAEDPQADIRIVKRPEAGGLRPGRPDRISEEQVADPGAGEDLGLAERPDRDPACPGGELQSRDRHALVGLGVRPQRDPAAVHLALETGDVRGDAVKVDDDARRVEAVRKGGTRDRAADEHVRRHRSVPVLVSGSGGPVPVSGSTPGRVGSPWLVTA